MNRCNEKSPASAVGGRALPRQSAGRRVTAFLGAARVTAVLAVLCAGAWWGALAQTVDPTAAVRTFPPGTQRGTLVVTMPPEVTLNGKPDRLSPGARIRQPNNLLALSGSLVGQSLTVNYTRDAAGLLHEVWILTPAEAARRLPTMPAGHSNVRTAADDERPAQDDGRTPFHELPRYGR